MQSTPEICKHKGILTHFTDYPEGSIERAKSIGIEVWCTSKSLQTTLKRWETELSILKKERPWKALGLKNADDFVRAVVGKTTKEISGEIKTRTRIKELADDHRHWTQQQIADEAGCSRQYVTKVLATENCELKNSVAVPDTMKSDRDKADFRKLSHELQEKVRAKEVSLNAAAIQAGIRKKPTPEDACLRAFRKCSDLTEMLRRLQEYYEVAMRHKESTDGRRLD